MKKNRKKKGFTLIELIVVIAVLAILALIAVPRLAGFTDRAKMANDKEYAAIVANSVQMLIATEELKFGSTAPYTVKYDNTWTIVGLTGAVGSDIEDLAGKETLEYYTSFIITVPTNGDIDKDSDISYTP